MGRTGRSGLRWSCASPLRGEEVWDIAKAYGATTAQILQANELEEETLPAGRMLLIPNAR
ncbi:MAG: LysM peptidoglycan-binding domain-containing protein [Lawsonibacter sp.]